MKHLLAVFKAKEVEALKEDAFISMGLLIAMLIAFGVKLPIFPLHSWMVRVHVQASPSVVMLHAGILLKIVHEGRCA